MLTVIALRIIAALAIATAVQSYRAKYSSRQVSWTAPRAKRTYIGA